MGRVILVYGKSGSGKSRSLKNFNEDEILLVKAINKDLPFRKKFKLVFNSDKVVGTDFTDEKGKKSHIDGICDKLKKMPTKIAVIDDAGYLMTNTVVRGNIAKGNKFDVYDNIASNMWMLFNCVQTLDDDVNVYVIMHEDTNEFGTKLKTLGKMLDNTICLEGMVTVCLRCMSENGQHFFRTKTDGNDITKSPEEMFDQDVIENDLKMVDDTIRKYYL